MPGWIAVDPPRDRLARRARPGRDVLADQHATGGGDPLVRRGKVLDEDVEMNPRHLVDVRRGAGLEGEPLAVRGGSSVTHPGYHSTGVPPSRPAQKRASAHGSAQSSTTSLIQPISPLIRSCLAPLDT